MSKLIIKINTKDSPLDMLKKTDGVIPELTVSYDGIPKYINRRIQEVIDGKTVKIETSNKSVCEHIEKRIDDGEISGDQVEFDLSRHNDDLQGFSITAYAP